MLAYRKKFSSLEAMKENLKEKNDASANELEQLFQDAEIWKAHTFPSTQEDLNVFSGTDLANGELDERKVWSAIRPLLSKDNRWERIQSRQSLLTRKVVAPELNTDYWSCKSTNTTDRNRRFPPDNERARFVDWPNFDTNVCDFSPNELSDQDSCSVVDPWYHSWLNTKPLSCEIEEQIYVEDYVLHPLGRMKMVGYKFHLEGRNKSVDQILTETSGCLRRTRVAVEFKATHNLWIPATVDEIRQAYMNDTHAFATHPIFQLLYGMFANSCVYGVLSSATRTYFMKLMQSIDEYGAAKLEIAMSRRWYVGEPNYLRAWAYVWQQALGDNNIQSRIDALGRWKVPPYKAKSPRKRSKKNLRTAENTDTSNAHSTPPSYGATEAPEVPYAHWSQFVFTNFILGRGQHGEVEEVCWKDQYVALKYFNTNDTEAMYLFEHELNIYRELYQEQGKLIPHLIFQCSEPAISALMLGIQVGRKVNLAKDVDAPKQKEEVIRRLAELGYVHEDTCGYKNFIYIPDKDSANKERLVAIDLEDVTRI